METYHQIESAAQEIKQSASGFGGSVQLVGTAGELIAKRDDTAADSPMLVVVPTESSGARDATTARGTPTTR